ncbi:two-component system sensor histidine kinase NtrB [Desulfoferrobacter suflitae]|uniref:two-component system sensor histidine kinase NtrB n=1 Tax=Desulfoferrobacter suflitae TaxID=2865782 RepID=UPI002164D8B1|nr:ATP-binding protein [Desulfoferrobacter suflitae]MCK8601028.1 PAS domain S-box protein [Desulfoferrobacter suflitae]
MDIPKRSTAKLPSESILWDILESVSDAVITIDEEHKVLLCNKAAEQMFGFSRAELIGHDVSPVIPNPHQTIHRDYVERYLNTGIPRVIGKARECYGLRKDGTSFPVEISYSVSKTGGHLYFTAVIRDISRRKEMEKEVRFVERLADVGKAVAHVAHEIRKPLMLIGGFARQVSRCDALKGDEKDRKKLGIIVEEVRRLEKLLNGVRLITRPSTSSRKESLLLNQLLSEAFDLLEPALKDRSIELQMDLAAGPIMIEGDPDQLKQVILNIVVNAIEAIPDQGKIRISSSASNREAHLTIADNGPGIPPEVQENIFDPFFTTKSDGTGLGLAISKNIIEDHGGSLKVRSIPGEGASFYISLPFDIP